MQDGDCVEVLYQEYRSQLRKHQPKKKKKKKNIDTILSVSTNFRLSKLVNQVGHKTRSLSTNQRADENFNKHTHTFDHDNNSIDSRDR